MKMQHQPLLYTKIIPIEYNYTKLRTYVIISILFFFLNKISTILNLVFIFSYIVTTVVHSFHNSNSHQNDMREMLNVFEKDYI